MSDHTRSHITDSILATPVVAGFFATLAGYTLETWLTIGSLVYVIILVIQKLWQMRGGPIAAWRVLSRCCRYLWTSFTVRA